MRFVGPVDTRGKLDADIGAQVSDYLRNFAGRVVDVTVTAHKSQRSVDQNAWVWGVAYPLLAEALGYDRHEIEELHYGLVAKWGGEHFDKRLAAMVPNKRSSKLTTKEFSDYMEWLVRFGATTCGVQIPLPDDAESADLARTA